MADTDENAQAVATALAEAMTGLTSIARTNWRKQSARTPLDRQDVLDVVEDFIEAGLIRQWKSAGGYKQLMPEAVAG